jgi:pimeloyl-ACP methyl ester carboxylesterase
MDDVYIPLDEGIRLRARVIGGEVGERPALLVPGAALLLDDLEPLAEGRRVISYDLRGRGGSDRDPNPTRRWTEYEVSDLEAVRRHFGLEQFQLMGWSYVGSVAARYAALNPDRVERLVLMSSIPARFPAPYDNPDAEAQLALSRIAVSALELVKELQAAGVDRSDPERYCRAMMETIVPRQMGVREALRRMKSDPCVYENEWVHNLSEHKKLHFPSQAWRRDWRDEARRIQAPTLVVHGDADLIPVAAAEEWAAVIPDARLFLMEGVGHFPHLEAPETFFSAVDWFLWGEWPDDAEVVEEL